MDSSESKKYAEEVDQVFHEIDQITEPNWSKSSLDYFDMATEQIKGLLEKINGNRIVGKFVTKYTESGEKFIDIEFNLKFPWDVCINPDVLNLLVMYSLLCKLTKGHPEDLKRYTHIVKELAFRLNKLETLTTERGIK